MEMPGWRWMLLVLLLGGQRLETSGISTPLVVSPHGMPMRPGAENLSTEGTQAEV
jgi:hypothetical protein